MGSKQSRPLLTLRKQSVAEADPVSFTRTHCYRRSFGSPCHTARAYPEGPQEFRKGRKGIMESRVLSRGVTCLQKCLDYSFQWYCQLSGPCLWLMEEGIVRQSWRPWDGACVFHVDVVHSWQFGNLCRFAAAHANRARAWRALSFLSYESV